MGKVRDELAYFMQEEICHQNIIDAIAVVILGSLTPRADFIPIMKHSTIQNNTSVCGKPYRKVHNVVQGHVLTLEFRSRVKK